MSDEDHARLAICLIPRRGLLEILEGRARIVGLPEDVRIVGLHQEFRQDGLALHLWSASYAPVEPGAMIPEELRLQFERIEEVRPDAVSG